MVALPPVVALATAVPFNKVEVGCIAPVRMITDGEEVVCVEEEVCEVFAVAIVLERRVTAPSGFPLVAVVDDNTVRTEPPPILGVDAKLVPERITAEPEVTPCPLVPATRR